MIEIIPSTTIAIYIIDYNEKFLSSFFLLNNIVYRIFNKSINCGYLPCVIQIRDKITDYEYICVNNSALPEAFENIMISNLIFYILFFTVFLGSIINWSSQLVYINANI